MEWKKSYKDFENWLNKKGLLEASRVTSKDIDYAVIVKDSQSALNQVNNMAFIDKAKSYGLTITDKSQIESCLNVTNFPITAESIKYMVIFHQAEGNANFSELYSEDTLPSTIKAYFHKT